MPTVNTLVVERSDLLGLGQMHQLRGRVGRSGPAGVRLPVPPRRQDAHRGGLRAAEDDRRGDRARLGLQDRHARPRDPRRRQPARRVAVRSHRRGRLRPLLPDGHRGRRRDEGRADPQPPAEIKLDVPTDAFLPADYVAKEELAARGVPAPGGASPRRRRSTTSAPSGRTATARCPSGRRCAAHRSAPCAPSAIASASPTSRSCPSDQARLAPLELKLSQTTRLRRLAQRRHLQGGRPPAGRADPAGVATRPTSSSSSCATSFRRMPLGRTRAGR